MKVWVYIDGFNLYNGCLRKTPYKWLDLLCFCKKLLPADDITYIKYFTALVNPRPNDLDQPYRQMTYWRALRTLGCVEIIEGHFLTKKTTLPLATSVDFIDRKAKRGEDTSKLTLRMAEVVRSEEKGTDVNLATHLVHDAHRSKFEAALIVSNDSDLKESIRIVRNDLRKVVGVYNPHPERPSVVLKKEASFYRDIEKKHYRDCLFPHKMTDARGDFEAPAGWI